MNEIIKVALKSDASNFERGFAVAQASVNGFNKAVGYAQESVRKIDDAVKGIGKRAAAFAATNAAIIASSTKIATSFETEMRQVNSILHESEGGFRNLNDRVLALSRNIPKSANDLAGALYEISSSGFEGAEGMEILEAAGVAAVAGMTKTETAAKAISGAINTWSLDVGEADDVADILFKTVESGVVTFEELALQMSDYTGLAQASGIALDEVSAAFAAITLSGMPASRAATATAGALRMMIKPSDALKEAVRGLGYESALTMVQEEGLRDTLLALSDSVDGNVTAMGEMFQDVEGLRGVLALTANDGELFTKTLNDIANEANRAGAAQEAYNEMSKALSVQMKQAELAFESLRIEIGQYYLPILSMGTKAMGSFFAILGDAAAPFKAVAAAILGLATAVGALGSLLLMNKVRTKLWQMAMAEAMKTSVGLRVVTNLGIQSSKGFSGALIDAARRAQLLGRANKVTSAGLVSLGGRLDRTGMKIQQMGLKMSQSSMNVAGSTSRLSGLGMASARASVGVNILGNSIMKLGMTSAATGNMMMRMTGRFRMVTRAGQAMGAMASFVQRRWAGLMGTGFLVMDMLSSWGATASMAKEEIRALADEVNQKYDTTSLEGMRDAYEDLYNQAKILEDQKGIDYGEWAGVGQVFKGGLEVLSPFNDNNVQEGLEQVLAISETLIKMEEDYNRAQKVVERVGGAMDLTTEETERLAQALGVDLTDGTKKTTAELEDLAATKTSAELREMARETDDVGVKMIAAAVAAQEGTFSLSDLGEQLKALRSPISDIIGDTVELTDAQKALAESSGRIGSFGSALTDALEAERDAAQKIVDEEVELLQERSKGVIEAAEDAAEKEGEALQRASEDRINAKEDEVQNLKQGSNTRKAAQRELEELRRRESDALKAHNDTRQDELEAMRDSEQKILEDQTANLQETVEAQVLSLTDMTNALTGANWKLAAWQQDLVTVAGRTDKEVADYLAGMGEEGVDIVHQMATGSEEEVAAMAQAIKDNMKLTGDEAVIELDAGMSMAELAAKQGAEATRSAILNELGLLPEDARGIFGKFGKQIQDGMNEILAGLDMPLIDLDLHGQAMPGDPDFIGPVHPRDLGPRPGDADFIGPIHPDTVRRRRALGGIDPQAMIRQSPTVLFGERSTGGEAFIPLGAAHRERSLSIWAEAGRLLGALPSASHGLMPVSSSYSTTNNGPTTITKRNETRFTGDIYASDPKAVLKYAERKRRSNQLVGRSN